MRDPSRIVSSIYGGAADFTDHIGAIALDPLRARTLLRRFPPFGGPTRGHHRHGKIASLGVRDKPRAMPWAARSSGRPGTSFALAG
jgi:hypothetical protein